MGGRETTLVRAEAFGRQLMWQCDGPLPKGFVLFVNQRVEQFPLEKTPLVEDFVRSGERTGMAQGLAMWTFEEYQKNTQTIAGSPYSCASIFPYTVTDDVVEIYPQDGGHFWHKTEYVNYSMKRVYAGRYHVKGATMFRLNIHSTGIAGLAPGDLYYQVDIRNRPILNYPILPAMIGKDLYIETQGETPVLMTGKHGQWIVLNADR